VTEYTWPDDLAPYAVSFYLQPHTGGSESPFSRKTKVYGLSAPRWICSLSFRGGYWGTRDLEAVGPNLDALLAKLKGRENRITIFDFRRSEPRSPQWTAGVGNLAAAAGSTSLTITGLQPGVKIYAGDYLGGDGRPHIFTAADFSAVAATADSSGRATVTFEPPLATAIAAGAAIFTQARGLFRLSSDDAGLNGVAVGEAQMMTLVFAEDL
jgi:hypothetical protein